MHDGVELEARGIAVAVVITEAFLREAEVQRAALGMDGLEPTVITHPLSTLTDTEIAGRADQAAAGARRIWLEAAAK
jgi:hypothetical protein